LKVVELGSVCEFENGDRGKNYPSRSDQVEKGVPFINAGCLKGWRIDTDELNYITEERYKLLNSGKLRPDDILFCLRGSLGKFAINKGGLKGAIASSLVLIRPKKDLNIDYLKNYFRSEQFRRLIEKADDSSSQPNLSATRVKKFPIPVPSLSDQKAIVAKLDRAQRLIDIDKEMLAKYDELIQSVFLEMFGDPVTNPNEWERVPFKKIAEIDKESFDPTDFRGSVEYVGLSSILKDSGKIIDVETITEGDVKSNKYRFSPNHILYGKLRPYLNKVAFPDFSGVCSTDILPIKARDEVSTKSFVGYLLKTKEFVNYADKNSSGANLPRISPTMVKKFEAFHPPLELQRKFDDFVTKVNSEKKKTLQASQKSKELFSSLVQGAFG